MTIGAWHGAHQAGYLVPFNVARIGTCGGPLVEERNDMAIVRFIYAGHAPARQQAAGQPSENTHAGLLDRAAHHQV
jgi:hypothetical protein